MRGRSLAFALAALPLLASAAGAPRISTAEAQFRAANPCPAGAVQGACKGYVVDRVIPRLCGGAEDPANMRWVTLAEAKEKARWDRIGCRPGRKLVLPGESTYSTEAFPLGEVPQPVERQALPVGGTRRDAVTTVAPEPANEAETPEE